LRSGENLEQGGCGPEGGCNAQRSGSCH